jgi:hypothetical protein
MSRTTVSDRAQVTCDCDSCANSIPGGSPCSGWFGSVAALFMDRNESGHYQFSYDNDPLGSRDHIHLLDIREADMGLSGGFDVRIGHYFQGGQLGIELIYWGLYPGSQQSILTPSGFVGTLDPILNFDRVSIGGTGVDAWTNGAGAHRIRRSFDIHNAEINLVNFSGCTIYDACGKPKFCFSWGAGFRFFQFSEELLFSTREAGMSARFDDGQNQIDYSVDVDNNLFGGQIGGEGRWFATDKLSIVLSSKVGLFGNSVQHRSRIQDEQGRIAIVNDGPLGGAAWDVNSHKGDVAVLAELNLALSYCLTQNISFIAGYRVMGVSNVALSADQIPTDLRRVNAASTIDSDNGLLLHGGHAGIEFLY